MRRLVLLAILAGNFGFAAPALAGPNVPLCFAIAENYNRCMRDQQRHGGHGGYGGHGGQYGQWGHDDEYGGYGGYGDDEGGYRGRGRRRAERAQAACAVWLMQMQANGCI